MIETKPTTGYWDTFYSKKVAPIQPSSFAKFCKDSIDKNKNLIEFGCGNGRDAFYFASEGINVIGLDKSEEVIDQDKTISKENPQFIKCDFTDLAATSHNFENIGSIYSRFTMHAISKEGMEKSLKWAYDNLEKGGKLFIEARTINDPLYGEGQSLENDAFQTTHFRRFLRITDTYESLIKLGFNVTYCIEDYLSAWYKDDKAVVLRIIANK